MRITVTATAICMAIVGLASAADVRASIKQPTNIPAQALAPALQRLAKDRNFQIVYVTEEIGARRTEGAVGEYTPEEALKQLLKGTGLTYKYLDDNTITIVTPTPAAAAQTSRDAQGGSGEASVRPATQESDASRQNEKKSAVELQEVVVTGSRLRPRATQGPQQVSVYTSQDIAQSGQSTVADFLSTLPAVSTAVTEAGFDTNGGAQTVRLRGLPVGSTLVLLDGRVVEGSGSNQSHGNPFDLNTLPLAAIERIEVVPEAASAVYGSDAIGGVVNIILRKDLNGGEVNVTTGRPTEGGYHDTTASAAFGRSFNRGNITVIGSYQTRGELSTDERDIAANRDYRRFGASDQRSTACQPGNVYSVDGSNLPGLSSSFAGIPPSNGGLTPASFAASSGVLNECNPVRSLIPATHRASVLLNGNYDFNDAIAGFFEAIYSRIEQDQLASPDSVSHVPVPAGNPFNPFGVPVLVDYRFASEGPHQNIVGPQYFSRILAGFKGHWAERWDWELAAWQSYDRTHYHETELNVPALFTALANTNPAQSINLFASGAPAAPAVLQQIVFDNPGTSYSKLQTVNAFVRGALFDLPGGPVDVVLGGEYNHETQSSFAPAEGSVAPDTFSRSVRSAFAEARVPLWAGNESTGGGDRLAATLAGRYDRYSDFGSRFTPAGGLEFRATDTLLLRATYGRAFKAPDLRAVYGSPLVVGPFELAPDPLRGGEIASATAKFGGNANIRPQTGTSRSLGVVWSSKASADLRISLTNFRVTQDNRIIQPNPTVVVQSPAAFPGLVTRAAPTASDIANGFAGKILSVDSSYINFGSLLVEGNDLDVNYRFHTAIGAFSPSLGVTNIYKYQAAVSPGAPLENRLGTASIDAFATRWKGTLALSWARRAWSARVAGRYLSSYQDYDLARILGDYWLFDASAHYDFGKALGSAHSLLNNAYADVAVVNAFDRKPQFSNYLGFGDGYDPHEWDIRGRFVSFSLGTRW